VDYQFTSSGTLGFSADAGNALKKLAATINHASADQNQMRINIDQPMSVAYRALPLAVSQPATEAPPVVMVKEGAMYGGPSR